MEKLIVNRKKPFSFSEKVVADYGVFQIREQNEIASKVSEFGILDLTFYNIPSDVMIRPSDFLKMVLKSGYVPLDIYCARAIFENKDAMMDLAFLWWNYFENNTNNPRLDKIMFLGNVVARNEKDRNHFSVFSYPFLFEIEKIKFMPYEDDATFTRNRDYILVFKKEFIAKL